jgi:hypothetical protein
VQGLFASFYFVPAFFALLALLAVWRIIRSFELSIAALRASLVVLCTLAFAPMLVPAGTIMTAWVPHGLLLIHVDFAYYLHTAKYAFPSFGITATIFSVFAFLSIREKPTALRINWATFAFPAFVVAISFGAYKLAFPDRDIPEKINTAAIEQAYGAKLDEVISLHNMSDPIVQQQVGEELKMHFDDDPSVIYVSLEDPGYPHTVSGQLFYFYQDDLNPPSKSCSGAAPPEQKGLIRCSWKGGGANRRNVVKYTRRFTYGDERLFVVIEFDFKELMRSLPD